MKISVIIPCYNRSQLVARAIDSVLMQTYPASELIVVDDHSNDDTAVVLQQFEDRITVISNSQNFGVSYSRNVGIESATGEWIAFLDSDDVWNPDKLNAQKIFHENNPGIRISQCDEIWIRNGVKVNPMVKHAKQGGWIFDSCLPLCIVSPSAVIIHEDVFKRVGLFDPQLPACEDYDLWLRVSSLYEIGFLKKKLVTRHGGHDDQLSKKYWGMDRFRITAMEKQLDTELPVNWRRALLEELIFKCRVVSEGASKRGNLVISDLYGEKQMLYEKKMELEFG